MKIAIIGSRGIPARYGGFEVFAEKLSTWLAEKGHQVTVYTTRALASEKLTSPIKRVFISAPKLFCMEKIILSSKSMLHAAFVGRPDVVVLLGISGAHLIWLLKLFGIKIVLNPDGIESKRGKWNLLGRIILKALESIGIRQANMIVADSVEISKYIYSTYNRVSCYIPYGVRIPQEVEDDWRDVERTFNVEKRGYYIVVARYAAENNFEKIIRGFTRSNSQLRLVVVADRFPSHLLSDKRLIYKGPVYERNRLFALRRNAAVYIHGHSVGGTNPSLLEAIAAFNVIFAYNVCFNREVLQTSAWYFRTPEDLSLLIERYETGRLGLDIEKMQRFQLAILKYKYNWDKVCAAYRIVLSDLCEASDAPQAGGYKALIPAILSRRPPNFHDNIVDNMVMPFDMTVTDVYEELEISKQEYRHQRQKYDGISPDIFKQFLVLQKENLQLRKTVAEQALSILTLKEAE